MRTKFFILMTLSLIITNTSNAKVLFNGEDLNGWKHVGNGKFILKDKLLMTEGGMGLLYYEKEKFSNVKITVIYKTSTPTSNSGIFVRIGDNPKSAWDAVHNGYEVQICDQGPDAADDYHRTGSVYSFAKAIGHAENKAGEWNTMVISLKEEFINVQLNGKQVATLAPLHIHPRVVDSDPKRGPREISGYIGLQNHDHTATEKDDHVYFKKVSVEAL